MEIIKTDDPNIVIERTFIDKPIDIEQISSVRDNYARLVAEYNDRISELMEVQGLSEVAMMAISNEANRLRGEKATYELEITRMDSIINA